MSKLNDILNTAGYGLAVSGHTGETIDASYAAGYAAWIKSITGSFPQVVRLPGNRVRLTLTAQQQKTMRDYFNSQIFKALKPADKKPRVEYELAPVLKPMAYSYGIPAALLFVGVGWFAHSILK